MSMILEPFVISNDLIVISSTKIFPANYSPKEKPRKKEEEEKPSSRIEFASLLRELN